MWFAKWMTILLLTASVLVLKIFSLYLHILRLKINHHPCDNVLTKCIHIPTTRMGSNFLDYALHSGMPLKMLTTRGPWATSLT